MESGIRGFFEKSVCLTWMRKRNRADNLVKMGLADYHEVGLTVWYQDVSAGYREVGRVRVANALFPIQEIESPEVKPSENTGITITRLVD